MAITPFNVIQGHRFWYNRKPIYDFLSMLNTNLPPILHRFQVMDDYVKFSLATGGRFILTPLLGEGGDSLRILP